MNKKLLLVFMVLLIGSLAFASKHDDAALTFFNLNTPEEQFGDMISENYDYILAIFLDGMEQEMGMNLSAADREPMKQLLDFILEVGMDYEKLQELSVPIIKSQFSLKELNELNSFLGSKTGGKYLDLYILNNSSYLATAIEQLFSTLTEDEEMVEKIGAKMLEIYGIDPDALLRDMIDGALDDATDDEYEEGDEYGFDDEYGYDEDEELVPADTTSTEDSDEESLNWDNDYQGFIDALEELGKIIETGVKGNADDRPIFDPIPYDNPPKVIGQIVPAYPDKARIAGIQGTVVLEVQVYKDGSVGDITVKRSIQAGPGGLDEAAIEAVRAVTFEPGKTGGEPVDSLVIIPVEFELN